MRENLNYIGLQSSVRTNPNIVFSGERKPYTLIGTFWLAVLHSEWGHVVKWKAGSSSWPHSMGHSLCWLGSISVCCNNEWWVTPRGWSHVTHAVSVLHCFLFLTLMKIVVITRVSVITRCVPHSGHWRHRILHADSWNKTLLFLFQEILSRRFPEVRQKETFSFFEQHSSVECS